MPFAVFVWGAGARGPPWNAVDALHDECPDALCFQPKG